MSATPTPLPELTYDSLSIGQRFSDTTLTVTAGMVRQYGRAVHNDALIREADAPSGTALSDPSLVILFGIARRALRLDARLPPGGILAGQDFEVSRPLRLGECIRTRPCIAAKYEKRGRRYVQIRCELGDENGARIGCVDSYIIWAR